MKTKKMLLIPCACLLLIQLFPIDRARPVSDPSESLESIYDPSEDIMISLKNACYDCHSNHTRYPWYARIQPVGWWMQRHIKMGREELNFSEIGRWEPEEQADLLQHCAKIIHKGAMPLGSYLKMHPEADLDTTEKERLVQWLLEPAVRLEQAGPVLAAWSGPQISPDTCDDPDANPRCCFTQMPEKLNSVLKLASDNEPGSRILIRGQFFKKDGKTPYPDVLIYAYQTDQTGRYTKKGGETGILRWHGRLHAWARTDAEGWYSIQSIRPAAYPGRTTPAHIHAVVWEPGDGQEPYYIRDFLFAGDPLLSPAERKEPQIKAKHSAVVTLKANPKGVLEGWRDIVL